VFVPIIRNNRLVFCLCFLQVFTDNLFPQWYFQAVQKMKFVTVINVFFRLLMIPFVFIFIKNPADIWIYALTVTLSMLLGAVSATYILWKNEGVIPRFIALKKVKKYFKEGLPFFWTSAMVVFKQESITLIIGIFFKISDVAIYDLANKLVLFLRIITTNINSALFPKVTANPQKQVVQKIIRYETFLGFASIGFTALSGYWFVLFWGGKAMILAYPLAVILSTLILTSLLAGSYINFVFIQKNKYYLVAQNQLIALLTYLFFTIMGLLFLKNIAIVVTAYALSGLTEVLYCKHLTKKYALL
jgi:PST family polysaccharide transporter